MVPRSEQERESDLRRHQRMLGGSEAAARYLATYGKVAVQAQNAISKIQLAIYLEVLRAEESPDTAYVIGRETRQELLSVEHRSEEEEGHAGDDPDCN